MSEDTDMIFRDESVAVGMSMTEDQMEDQEELIEADTKSKFPPPIIKVDERKLDSFKTWLDQWLDDLLNDQQNKLKEWSEQEEAYRALPEGSKTRPYIGACSDVIPVIAMAVDPIHARLDTGIFKQDPVFRLKGLKKSVLKYTTALEQWINYYQRHKLQLRRVASPRLLEMTKLGTCVFKTVYDRQSAKIQTYDPESNWEVIEKTEVRFSGPRVFGISLGDFLFPASYQFLQDCPIVAERQRTTYMKLKVAEASGKLTGVDKIKGQEVNSRNELETTREKMSGHESSRRYHDDIEVFEVWCDYDINDDGLPEHLVCTYHKDSGTILQLRYNWYFHQKKPYTVIPYSITNDSLYGMGIGEMVLPFQKAMTKWHQMATDNAYLSNIRMFIVKKESGIEEVPRLYAGRCFFVDDPRSDFIPFASGDIYPSTLQERQNLFGLVEKRTGVSDYLTGRESPIIGSRATATSTLALIEEGTKRVEEVLENIRAGFSEIIENCTYIWIQYGLDDVDQVVFGDDEIGQLVTEFFDTVDADNVNGSMAIDLAATDASGSRQAMQQMQLQIIQVMMGYLEKVLAAGQGALMAQQTMPQLAEMIGDVMTAARNMFKDLLSKYDIRNPEDYLPDLEKYINGGQTASAGQVNGGVDEGFPGGSAGLGFMAGGIAPPNGFRGPSPAAPGSGAPTPLTLPMPGGTSGF